MRLVATLLLLAMAAVFVAARWAAPAHPVAGYVRAFAEAAMVGGLADWFAVTALFRRPLGLPIPHTAIIPANKDRIGDSLATFLRENFLTPAVVARRLEDVDMAGTAAGWLVADRPASTRRSGVNALLIRLLGALDDAGVGTLVRDAAVERLTATPLSPLVASAIDSTLDQGRHEPLIEAAIGWGLRTLDEQEMQIRGLVSERTSWFLRIVNVDDRVANSIMDGLRGLLVEMAGNPDHPVRRRIGESLRVYAFDLRHFPEAQAKVEGFKTGLLESEAIGQWLEGLWDSLRTGAVKALADPAAERSGRLGQAMKALGQRLQADEPLRAAINLHLRRAAVGLTQDYGDGIVRLVSDTIRGWDARTVTDKLEAAVGRDLQYIRINGTLIGGLVGLAIHTLGVVLPG
jgi:uncharacterized membrane-anchored protein YjiN (DUF445 family)